MLAAHIRGEIWMHISGGFGALDKQPLLYQSLLNTHYDIDIGEWLWLTIVYLRFEATLQFNWNSMLFFIDWKLNVCFFLFLHGPVDAIRIDLPRTFPENVFFENIRTPLFNVLVAYANHNKEIGYCQGLNYIAGKRSTSMNLPSLLWWPWDFVLNRNNESSLGQIFFSYFVLRMLTSKREKK